MRAKHAHPRLQTGQHRTPYCLPFWSRLRLGCSRVSSPDWALTAEPLSEGQRGKRQKMRLAPLWLANGSCEGGTSGRARDGRGDWKRGRRLSNGSPTDNAMLRSAASFSAPDPESRGAFALKPENGTAGFILVGPGLLVGQSGQYFCLLNITTRGGARVCGPTPICIECLSFVKISVIDPFAFHARALSVTCCRCVLRGSVGYHQGSLFGYSRNLGDPNHDSVSLPG